MAWHVRVAADGLGILIESGEGDHVETVYYFAVKPENSAEMEHALWVICDAHNAVTATKP